MNYQSLTKSELIKELERLKKVSKPKPRIVRPKAPRSKKIIAGCAIKKDDLLVVDEAKRVAWIHPEVQTVPNEIRIHGYAARSYKKGEVVKIRNWWEYEPE